MPTPLHRSGRAHQIVAWLNPAARGQLRLDLENLPDLADALDEHRAELLRAGTRTLDDTGRIPADLHVVDLTDQRVKDGPAILDPIGEADLARRIGERRHGILPTLTSWVSLAVGEMHDLGVEHVPPADPDRTVWAVTTTGDVHATKPGVTVTTEAGWILQHLDWIAGQQWVVELAHDVRSMAADLDALVGTRRPDDRTVLCALDLAELLDVSSSTVRMWKARGLIDWATDPSGDVIRDVKGRRGFWVVEARAIMRDTRGCRTLRGGPDRANVTA